MFPFLILFNVQKVQNFKIWDHHSLVAVDTRFPVSYSKARLFLSIDILLKLNYGIKKNWKSYITGCRILWSIEVSTTLRLTDSSRLFGIESFFSIKYVLNSTFFNRSIRIMLIFHIQNCFWIDWFNHFFEAPESGRLAHRCFGTQISCLMGGIFCLVILCVLTGEAYWTSSSESGPSRHLVAPSKHRISPSRITGPRRLSVTSLGSAKADFGARIRGSFRQSLRLEQHPGRPGRREALCLLADDGGPIDERGAGRETGHGSADSGDQLEGGPTGAGWGDWRHDSKGHAFEGLRHV